MYKTLQRRSRDPYKMIVLEVWRKAGGGEGGEEAAPGSVPRQRLRVGQGHSAVATTAEL